MNCVLDSKCITRKKCWYCNGLCNNCLQPTSLGIRHSSLRNPRIIQTFCSETCKVYSGCSESQFFIQILDLKTSDHDASGEKQEIFRIQGRLGIVNITFSMSVYFCNSDYYILYYERDDLSKKFSEFYVSNEGTFLRFFPHFNTLDVSDYAEDLAFFTYLTTHVEMGFKCFEVCSNEAYNANAPVVIPIGMSFKEDVLLERNVYFPKDVFEKSPLKMVLSSLKAYKIMSVLESEQAIANNYLIPLCSAQIEFILSTVDHKPEELYVLSLNILTGIISGL